jgi:hypothetical protein
MTIRFLEYLLNIFIWFSEWGEGPTFVTGLGSTSHLSGPDCVSVQFNCQKFDESELRNFYHIESQTILSTLVAFLFTLSRVCGL